MAKITLDKIRHSYLEHPVDDADWALKEMDFTWSDGGAYALLGPSGCGKTTLLNIISGLICPSEGRVLFDDKDMTNIPSDKREIAQVFQFPVVYDTMTVYDNLAFPLKNRGASAKQIEQRVHEIARMLDLEDSLHNRAAKLTADGKQKISLGRGLIRPDVNVIMFDEPLTVIDPHLKWILRSKLKTLHEQVGITMIYVTHDQTEALTFADRVVVMHDGMVVQIGTPIELFEKPSHTFVGHFIGSPGMNLLPCSLSENGASLFDHKIEVASPIQQAPATAQLEIGIRPEFIQFAADGLPVQVTKVNDIGRFRIVETSCHQQKIKLIVAEGEPIPEGSAHLRFDPEMTQIYADGWIIT